MSSRILDFSKDNGLVICQNHQEAKNNVERLYISEAKKLKAYAVLFRRYYRKNDDSHPYNSEPAVCIFKEEDIVFNSLEHIALHAALWSGSKNEIYIILGKTRADIMINARKPAEKDENQKLNINNLKLAEVLKGASDERFSAYLFGSGTFWEQSEFSDKLDEKNSPYVHLLEYLMTVRKHFLYSPNGLNLGSATVDKLLIVSILVKFLEEIKDDDGKHTLLSIYKKHKVESFSEAVQAGFILDIFSALSSEFNGKIFDNFTNSEKKKIKSTDLSLLSQFISAKINIATSQFFLWEQYSFNHLPAEVISAIYENFIQAEAARKNGTNEKGVVYTPIHLVNFLVDEVMPLDKPELFLNQNFRVLDPTCGSGVFLVAAYKRLLQWWAINNSSADNIQYPNSKVSQRILKDNIFGVDVKETAILISMLGLTTALLDKLTPKEIWNKLKFKDLSKKNLQHSSFFKWAVIAKETNQKFDLVIGNPPFNPETGVKKEKVLLPNLLRKLDFKHKKIPRSNFALHFFEGSMALANKICMIIPSNVMLYDKASQRYRKEVFKNYSVSNIYDFTHLRRALFHKSADTPIVAIVAENKPSNLEPINHTVVKRMVSSENKLRFEIDHYDRFSVRFDWAVDDSKQFIWKTNLLGGGRLFHLIYRLSSLSTLSDFIEVKKSWKQIRGFEGGAKTFLKNVDRIDHIDNNGKPNIQTNVTIQTDSLKDKFMYEPPFMIIDQVLGESNLSVCFIPKNNPYTMKSHLYYNRDFIGISVPESDETILENISNLLVHKNSSHLNPQLYILAKSSSSLILTETDINKSEILDVPFPEDKSYLSLSDSEQILQNDVLKYYIHLGKSINRNSAGSILNIKVSESQLREYGTTLCDALNSIYARNNKSWQLGKIYQVSLFTVCQIGFGNGNSKNLPHEYIDSGNDSIASLLKEATSNRGAIFKRVIRIYKHINDYDCIFLVKPNALRYWLKSIALHDADDTLMDLKNGGF